MHFITTIDNGGAENHLRDLVAHQSAEFDVTVVYFKGRPYYLDYFKSLNVSVIKSSWWWVSKNLRIIRSARIVHAHLIYAEIAIFLTKVIKNTSYFVSKHNDAKYSCIPRWMARLIFPRLNKRFSKIICITKNVKKYCLEYQNQEESKLEVIYYGIEIDAFTRFSNDKILRMRNELVGSKDVMLIGVVARLHKQKRLDILLRALQKHREKNWELVVAGEGEERDSLLALSRSLKIDHKVRFLGKIDYVPLFMNSIDLFVLPSEHEGLGLVLLEALSTGVEIIGSDAGAIPEVLGDHGRVFKTNDVSSLSALLDECMDESRTISSGEIELRRSRLMQVFDIKRNYDSINSLYTGAVNGNN